MSCSDHEVTEGGVERSTGWTIFHNGLKTDKFRTGDASYCIYMYMYMYMRIPDIQCIYIQYICTVEKFCIFLEFMLSPETDLDWNDDSSTVITIQVTSLYYDVIGVSCNLSMTSSGYGGLLVLSGSTATTRQDFQRCQSSPVLPQQPLCDHSQGGCLYLSIHKRPGPLLTCVYIVCHKYMYVVCVASWVRDPTEVTFLQDGV